MEHIARPIVRDFLLPFIAKFFSVNGPPVEAGNLAPSPLGKFIAGTRASDAAAESPSPEDNLPSWSAAEALKRQEPYINNVLATNTLSMLTQLLRYGQLSYQGGFYNAKSGRIVPIEAGFKEQKIRKRRPIHEAA